MTENELTIKEENIIFDLDLRNIEEIIGELTNKLYSSGYINNKKEFIEAVIERENEIPTSIGNEIAIPHGKSDSVTQSTVALCVLKEKIKWGEKTEDEVKYIFLLAIKDVDKGEKHLRMLANLSSKLMDKEFVRKFKNAKTKNELFKVINNI